MKSQEGGDVHPSQGLHSASREGADEKTAESDGRGPPNALALLLPLKVQGCYYGRGDLTPWIVVCVTDGRGHGLRQHPEGNQAKSHVLRVDGAQGQRAVLFTPRAAPSAPDLNLHVP